MAIKGMRPLALILLLCGCEAEVRSNLDLAEGATSQELECWGWCYLWETSSEGDTKINRPQTRPWR
jgi:hypothetical protein